MKNLFVTFLLVFSFSVITQSNSQVISRQISEARSIGQKWMERKSRGLIKKDTFSGQYERAEYIISGIPSHIKYINPDKRIFRHYVGSNMEIILKTSQLKTGITPYVILAPGFSKEIYEDLVGIFLTTPATPPEKVGLEANPNADYIDFSLYAGTPVVEIEPEILVIPGRPDIPEWLKSRYLDYKTSGRVDRQYEELFKRIDLRGGINPTFMKIKILRYRSEGKIFRLTP